MLLGVYENKPLGGSSYIELPKYIISRRAVINPQNIDHQCFKWAILAKHVAHDHRNRVGKNYLNEVYRYDFSSLSVPTPVSEIALFDRCNFGTSVNVYAVRKNIESTTRDVVYPIRVTDEERKNHFHILLIEDSEKSHYAYIVDFSQLISGQKNTHGHKMFIC